MDLKELFYHIWIPLVLLLNCVGNTSNIYSIINYLTLAMLIYIDDTKNINKRTKSTQVSILNSNENKSSQAITIETNEIGIQKDETKYSTSTASQTSIINKKEKGIQKNEVKNIQTTATQTSIINRNEKSIQINGNKKLASTEVQTSLIETEEIGIQTTEDKNFISTASQTNKVQANDKAVQTTDYKISFSTENQKSIKDTNSKSEQKNDDDYILPAENQILNDNTFTNIQPNFNDPADDPFFSLSSLSVLPSSSSEIQAKKKKNSWGRFKKSIKKLLSQRK